MSGRIHPGALMLALAAFVWHVMLMTSAANDNFMHMAMAQQWLAGDWPVRDFFDNGRLLQYSLSALAQVTIGDRIWNYGYLPLAKTVDLAGLVVARLQQGSIATYLLYSFVTLILLLGLVL